MTTPISRISIGARYRISGDLVLDTALHLGGGRNPAKGSDAPILRNGYGRPYLPGSSLKGALRAAVERIAPVLNVSACSLFVQQKYNGENPPSEIKPECFCLTPLPEDHPAKKTYRNLEEAVGKPLSKDLKNDIEKHLENGAYKLSVGKDVDEDLLLAVLEKNLCRVCLAFGAPFIASAIYFHDAAINEEKWLGLTQVRDGVGIDRDSGRAVDRIKYDYEIVPPQSVFDFSMTIESGDEMTLALAALALHELAQGNVPLGGIRSRGLGRCHLESSTAHVEALDFTPAALKAYLTKNEFKKLTLDEFIQQNIKTLWAEQEASHV